MTAHQDIEQQSTEGQAEPPLIDVAVVGTGFSGIGMAVALKEMALGSFAVFEKGSDVGGTWRDNHYPGCACDVQSKLYSFSFAPNSEWSKAFAEQGEIYQYLRDVVEDRELRPHIHFGHTLKSAEYLADLQRWRLDFENGRIVEARQVISGIGALHVPKAPDIPGLENFNGPVFHSAEWDHKTDLTGKRIAVIGTGASAIQFVPQITDRANQITVFQRSPAWVMPKPDRTIPEWEKSLYRRYNSLMTLQRGRTYLQLEGRALVFRQAKSLLKLMERRSKRYINRRIEDPKKRELLTPDYRMGCKRILISNDYYEALNRDHVEIESARVETIEGNTLIDANGQSREFDVIILGTGFKTLEAIESLDIRNGEGVSLAEAWKDGARCHLGSCISGFPNFFMLLGPNTGLGHNSQVYMIESQIRYISDALRQMRSYDIGSVAVRETAQNAHVAMVQRLMKDTIWKTGCKSWYLNDRGENWTTWPGFTFAFRWLTRRARLADFHCEPVRSAALASNQA